MTDKKISELPSLSGANKVNSDILPIVDLSTNTTSKITVTDLLTDPPLNGTATGTAITQTSIDTTANKLFKVGDFGIGVEEDGQSASLRITDGQSSLPSGFFSGPGSSGVNYPGITRFAPFLNIIRRVGTGSWIESRLFLGGPNNTFTNYSPDNGVTWESSKVYTQGSILGTVSQSSGVPTGAVIERGSNANGEYVRFADGTQICTRVSLSLVSTGGTTWTFPAAFSSSPVVGGTTLASSASANLSYDSTPTTTAAILSSWSSNNLRQNVTASVTATGRWF